MNKKLLIVVGVVLILLLVGVWTYLLVFGTPESVDDVYADFGFAPTDDTSLPPPAAPTTPPESEPVVEEEPLVDTNSALAQLTTRAVAGYRSLATATNTIRYVELGTGHIYEIDLESGKESVVSKNTVPQAHDAHLTPDGETVVVRSRYHGTSEVILGRISASSSELNVSVVDDLVGAPVLDYHIGEENELLYTIQNSRGLRAASLDLNSLSQRNLFSVPFTAALIHWGDTAESSHYVQTKPSNKLPGYLYRANGRLSPLPISGRGLLAVPGDTYILFNTIEAAGYTARQFNRTTGAQGPGSLIALPEKCDAAEAVTKVYCAGGAAVSSEVLPDAWYQGTHSFADSLWEIRPEERSAELMIDLTKESGRRIDVVGLTNDEQNERLFFINKNDNSLWTYAY